MIHFLIICAVLAVMLMIGSAVLQLGLFIIIGVPMAIFGAIGAVIERMRKPSDWGGNEN